MLAERITRNIEEFLREYNILEIVMTKSISLDVLWDSATPTEIVFNPDKLAHLPAAAKRYLEHAIAPGTKLTAAVRLKMHGEIKLKKWIPFTAEQVICWEYGLIWSATAWMNGFLPIVGSDSPEERLRQRVIDGIGTMQWKLLGLFPVMTANGADITRSAVGRLESESLCLPSVFYRDDVSFTSMELSPLDSKLHSSFVVQGEKAELDFMIDQTGRLKTFKLPCWGNPDGAEFRDVDLELWRKRAHLAATPFPPVYGLAGTLEPIGLNQRASSFAPQSMMQSIVRPNSVRCWVVS
jgi:hypothetical protein